MRQNIRGRQTNTAYFWLGDSFWRTLPVAAIKFTFKCFWERSYTWAVISFWHFQDLVNIRQIFLGVTTNWYKERYYLFTHWKVLLKVLNHGEVFTLSLWFTVFWQTSPINLFGVARYGLAEPSNVKLTDKVDSDLQLLTWDEESKSKSWGVVNASLSLRRRELIVSAQFTMFSEPNLTSTVSFRVWEAFWHKDQKQTSPTAENAAVWKSRC